MKLLLAIAALLVAIPITPGRPLCCWAQETLSAPFLDRSSGTWVLRGTPAIEDALARELPDFVPWDIRDYVPDAVYWYGAVADSFSERQAMFAAIGDFNADGAADVAIDGRTATERLLVFVLSDGPGYETLVLERTPLEEKYDRRSVFLRLLPRGSALQCLEGDIALPSNRVTLAADAVEVDLFEKAAHAWYFEAGEFRSCSTAD